MQFVLCALTGYLIGNINPSYIIARLRGFDIRERGSGNAGASNAVMTMGRKVGAASALFDIFKAFLASMLAAQLFPQIKFAKILSGCSCIIGHIYPVFMGFHGGKGISVGLGAGLGFCWPVTLMMLAVFLVLAVPTRYVSLGSVSAAISLPIISFAWGIRGVAIVPLLVVAAVVVFAHRGNIKKLAYGQERKFSVHKRGGQKDGR